MRYRVICSAAVLFFSGCMDAGMKSDSASRRPGVVKAQLESIGVAEHNHHDAHTRAPYQSGWVSDEDAPAKAAADQQSDTIQRKMIYEAQVSLVVQDFEQSEKDVPKFVSEHDGYLADVMVDRTQGSRRTGRWVARVPVAKYEVFLVALRSLGVPEHTQQTARDVTDQFIDLEAQIKNQKKVEVRLVKLLDEKTGKLEDILKAESQLARVRTEIDSAQGRLDYLTNQTDFTTVTINVREERDYVAPEAKTFVARIGDAWTGSLAGLLVFSKNSVVVLVAVFPWIGVLCVVFIPAVILLRRRWRRRRQLVATV